MRRVAQIRGNPSGPALHGLAAPKATSRRRAPPCPTTHGAQRAYEQPGPRPSAPGCNARMTDLPPAPPLHRMWLKTAGDRDTVERLCLDGGFLGLGWGYRWRPQPPPKTVTWEKYIVWAESYWPGRDTANVRRLHDADGLIWTRTVDGIYYLAEFTGEWEYRRGDPYDAHDLNNTRPARIEQVGPETAVPGAVVRRFSRQGQAFSRVWDDSAARYSALIWAQKTGQPYAWRASVQDVLNTLLSPFDVQDLVAAYLQAERGWLLFPSRLSDSTAAYEYVLRDPATGDNYAVQVKTGQSEIELRALELAAALQGWVVFSTAGAYRGRKRSHVEELHSDVLLRFVTTRRDALPPVVASWMAAAEM